MLRKKEPKKVKKWGFGRGFCVRRGEFMMRAEA